MAWRETEDAQIRETEADEQRYDEDGPPGEGTSYVRTCWQTTMMGVG